MSKSFLVFTVGLSSMSLQTQTPTRGNCAPVSDSQNSITVGDNGIVLSQDVQLVKKLQYFVREGIAEYIVYALATGAHSEQSTFVLCNILPDIELSEDRIMQCRLFDCADTQLYLFRVNLLQLPINRPSIPVNNHHQNRFSSNATQTRGYVKHEPSKKLTLSENVQFKAVEINLIGTAQ